MLDLKKDYPYSGVANLSCGLTLFWISGLHCYMIRQENFETEKCIDLAI